MDIKLRRADTGPSTPVLAVIGSLDIASKEVFLPEALAALAPDEVVELTLDLGEVSFIDSSGLGALIEVRGAAEDADKKLVLREISARVQRIFEVTGLTSVFAPED